MISLRIHPLHFAGNVGFLHGENIYHDREHRAVRIGRCRVLGMDLARNIGASVVNRERLHLGILELDLQHSGKGRGDLAHVYLAH